MSILDLIDNRICIVAFLVGDYLKNDDEMIVDKNLAGKDCALPDTVHLLVITLQQFGKSFRLRFQFFAKRTHDENVCFF